jgi:ParB/RepB/Spo0J family partition protein
MSTATAVSDKRVVSQFLPLTSLHESPTNPRKYFDPKKLKELSESVKAHGILEPLVVRPNGKPSETEIVCGARRFRAAKMAGLTEVPVVFREFSDEEVQIVQLVENGQRDDLSPIEEAETYAALAAKGLTPREIAKRLGRDGRDVARRLPLASLPKRVKDAFSSGTLPVEYAELIARIPDPKLQEEALSAIVEEWTDDQSDPVKRVVPYAAAKRTIEEEFMATLAVAVFDPEDATLSPLGACSKCPHLAGNNPDLFGDVKAKAVCTNPKDFRLKTETHLKRLRETGYTVLLSQNELKRAFPYAGSAELGKEFVDLEAVCPDDPKRRRYEELLGKGDKLKAVYALKGGRVRKLYPSKDVKPALVAGGHAFAKEKPKRPSEKEASRSAAQLERIGDEAVCRELAVRLRSVKLMPSGWIDLLLRIAVIGEDWKVEGVIRRHGFDGSREEFAKHRERIVKERIEALSDAEKRAFLVDLLSGDWMGSADKAEAEMHRHLLKLGGVNAATVANRAIDAAKKKAAEAKQTPKPPIAAKSVRVPKAAGRS